MTFVAILVISGTDCGTNSGTELTNIATNVILTIFEAINKNM